jgi:hypothetical protein
MTDIGTHIQSLKDALWKEGIILRALITTNTNGIVNLLNSEGKQVEKIVYPFPTNDFSLKLEGDKGVILRDYPWREEYVWEQNLTLTQFFLWRPFFEQVYKSFKNPIGAEVGVLEGYLSKNILENNRPSIFYLIDPWKEFSDCCGNIRFDQSVFDLVFGEIEARFKKLPNIVILRKTSLEGSKEIADGSLDFVYLDGDHSAGAVYQDISIWLPKLKSGGLLGGHDFTESTVKSGLYRFLSENGGIDTYDLKYGYNDWWFFKP